MISLLIPAVFVFMNGKKVSSRSGRRFASGALLLCLLIPVCLAGVGSAAAVDVSSWSELQSAVNDGENATLTQDITAGSTQTYINISKNVQINMNGHTISRGLSSSYLEGGYVFHINSGNMLLLAGPGTVTGGSTYGDGGAFYCEGRLVLDGTNGKITISGNAATGSGGAVYLKGSSAALQLRGSNTITGNSAAKGGGVFVSSDSSFVVRGTVQIKENMPNNVYLSGSVITVGSTMDTSSEIWVDAEVIGSYVFTSGLAGGGSVTYFTPDNAVIYSINTNASGEASLVRIPDAPTFSPLQGIYVGSQNVEISSSSSAVIYYTLDGSTPSSGSTQYNAPINVASDTTIKAIACRHNFLSVCSSVASASYTIQDVDYTLNVSVPDFEEVIYGYDQPDAKAITISSEGNSDATIASVTLSGVNAGSFTLDSSGASTTVTAGGTNETYTVRPNADLAVGTYTARVTVTYNDNAFTYADMTFTVKKAPNRLQVSGSAEVIVDGNTVDLSNYVTGADGTVSYAISGASLGCTVSSTLGVLTSGTYIGSVTVQVTASGNESYEEATAEIPVEVKGKNTADLSVTQESIISSQTLPGPEYEKPAGIKSETILYSGTLESGQDYDVTEAPPDQPGTYVVLVFCETADTIYTGEAAFTITAATYTLTVTAPEFAAETYGYTQPSAQAITITSSGNSDAAIASVSLSGTNAGSFTLITSGASAAVTAGGTNETYTVQPNAGLAVGTYTATVTVTYNDNAAASADLTFTVEKAPNRAQVTASTEVLEGGFTVDLSDNVSGADGSVSYEISGSALGCSLDSATGVFTSGDEPGQVKVIVTASGDDNYSEMTAEITVTVNEKDTAQLTTTPVAADGWTADGSAYSLLSVEGASDDGTVMYSVNGGSWSSTAPTASAAGNYTITYYIKGDDTHKDNGSENTPLGTLTVTVEKPTAALTTAPEAADGWTEDGTSHPLLSVEGASDDGTVMYSVNGGSWSAAAPTASAAGSYTVSYYIKADDDHNDNGSEDAPLGTLTVTVAEQEVAALKTTPVAADGWTEDGDEHPLLSVEGESDEGTVMYSINGGEWSSTPPTASAADTYTISYYIKGDNTHKDNGSEDAPLGTLTVTVNEQGTAELKTAPAAAEGWTEDGEEYSLLSVAGESDEGTVMYSVNGGEWTSEVPTASEAGTYEIRYYIKGDDNHKDNGSEDEPIGTLTVTVSEQGVAALITAPVAAEGWTEDGEFHSLLSVAGASNEGTVMYSVNNGEWSTQIPQASKAGAYAIRYYIKGDSTHKDNGSKNKPLGTLTVVVSKESYEAQMKVNVVYLKKNGSRGIPEDIKETELKGITVLIKKGQKTVSMSDSFSLELTGGAKKFSQTLTFSKKIDLAPGKYSISVTGLPKTVEDIFSEKGKVSGYKLSYQAEINEKNGSIVITVYLIFDSGAMFVEPPVVIPLPEDEIGAYAIRADGTKEYLLFHTYDICMAWLGRDDLCSGYERCFHKTYQQWLSENHK